MAGTINPSTIDPGTGINEFLEQLKEEAQRGMAIPSYMMPGNPSKYAEYKARMETEEAQRKEQVMYAPIDIDSSDICMRAHNRIFLNLRQTLLMFHILREKVGPELFKNNCYTLDSEVVMRLMDMMRQNPCPMCYVEGRSEPECFTIEEMRTEIIKLCNRLESTLGDHAVINKIRCEYCITVRLLNGEVVSNQSQGTRQLGRYGIRQYGRDEIGTGYVNPWTGARTDPDIVTMGVDYATEENLVSVSQMYDRINIDRAEERERYNAERRQHIRHGEL